MPSQSSSSLDLVVTMSCGLTLQICLIIAQSFRCRCWRFGLTVPNWMQIDYWLVGEFTQTIVLFYGICLLINWVPCRSGPTLQLNLEPPLLWRWLTLSTSGKISSRQKFGFFSYFSQETGLKTISWNDKFWFLEKIRKILSICHLLNLPREW